ncbi:hypothetical protein AB6A40_001365 [Gnathostoma spinigerum]|uniref:Uncharacterized protein n=1 Tax=Gnathostoma spinigerum TaxID=75299 RepID=A0ABD6E686_9BILA
MTLTITDDITDDRVTITDDILSDHSETAEILILFPFNSATVPDDLPRFIPEQTALIIVPDIQYTFLLSLDPGQRNIDELDVAKSVSQPLDRDIEVSLEEAASLSLFKGLRRFHRSTFLEASKCIRLKF